MFDDEEAGAIDTAEGESWTPPADYPAADPMQGMGGGDNSGVPAIPVPAGAPAGGDNSGQPAIPPPNMGAQGAPPEQGTPGWKPEGSGPLAPVGRGIKSIVSYLMGADAMPPQAIDGAGKTVDPRGELNPSQRNLLAVQHARENGGDDAAWALMQSNRVAYNAQTSFGKAALQGTPQKPPNLMAAIDAANKAQANVLDGTNVEFRPLQGGQAITATVTGPDGAPQQIVLSPQAFAKWLDVGGDGQWDKIMSTSAVATLQKLAAEGPSRGAKTMAEAPPVPNARERAPLQPPQPDEGEEPTATPTRKTAYGTAAAPSTINLSGSDEAGVDQPDETDYDPKTKARAFQKFPGITQQADRNTYMDADEQRKAVLENSVLVAAEGRKGKEEVAHIQAGGRLEQQRARNEGNVAVADIKGKATAEAQQKRALLEVQKMEQAGKREDGRNARAEIMNPNFLLQDEATRNAILKKYRINPAEQGAPQAPVEAPQQQGAPAAPQGQSAPQRAQLSDGKYYIRGPDGKAKLDPNQNP